MNNNQYDTNYNYWDIQLQMILSEKLLNEVVKFHQSTSIINQNNEIVPYSPEILQWLSSVEFTDIIPNFILDEIKFNTNKTNFQGSKRDFVNKKINIELLGDILYRAFGRSMLTQSKRYPSAGGLYPVIPLVYIIDAESIEEKSVKRGVYVYDSTECKLCCIKTWGEEEKSELIKVLNSMDGKIYSNIAIGYAVDLRRAIAKYKKRGYRHALIEIGLMAQAFRESLIDTNLNFGDFCWSGFDDNALTYLSGLNPRLCPVTLIQWFGEIKS